MAQMSQIEWLKDWFRTHDSINRVIAMQEGSIGRLGARIYDLKNDHGYLFDEEPMDWKNARGKVVRITKYIFKGKGAVGEAKPLDGPGNGDPEPRTVESPAYRPSLVDANGQAHFA